MTGPHETAILEAIRHNNDMIDIIVSIYRDGPDTKGFCEPYVLRIKALENFLTYAKELDSYE